MSYIKTALERFQSYREAKGIPEKSSLVHIHKMAEFEKHELKELRERINELEVALASKQEDCKDCYAVGTTCVSCDLKQEHTE